MAASNAEYQQVWRLRHPELNRVRKFIYQDARATCQEMVERFPHLDRQLVRRIIQRDFRELFNPDLGVGLDVATVAILPSALFGTVYVKYEHGFVPRFDLPWLIIVRRDLRLANLVGEKNLHYISRAIGPKRVTDQIKVIWRAFALAISLGQDRDEVSFMVFMPGLLRLVDAGLIFPLFPVPRVLRRPCFLCDPSTDLELEIKFDKYLTGLGTKRSPVRLEKGQSWSHFMHSSFWAMVEYAIRKKSRDHALVERLSALRTLGMVYTAIFTRMGAKRSSSGIR